MPDHEPLAQHEPLAHHEHRTGGLAETLRFLKRSRDELRELRRVRVARDWLRLYDVNGDCFLVAGVGYLDPDVKPVLDALNTAYNPQSIHQEIDRPYKEFKTGRRRPWAEDRVM